MRRVNPIQWFALQIAGYINQHTTNVGREIMTDISKVNDSIQAQTDANTALANNVAAVATELQTLANEVAGLKVGSVTQAQLDDIATRAQAQADATKAASDALAAATAAAIAADAPPVVADPSAPTALD